MTQNIAGPFYSNCLLGAVKAKIRHPFKIKITVVPRSEGGCPHFLWSDGSYDYDFGVERYLAGMQVLLFRGYVRQRDLGFNKKYKEQMSRRWNRTDNHGKAYSLCRRLSEGEKIDAKNRC